MYLTKIEERMLSGRYGPSIGKAMEILAAVGEIYGASRIIDISSVHVSGISYASAGESGTRLVEDFACSGCAFVVPTSSNVIAMDSARWKELGFPEDYVERQNRMLKSYQSMGIIPTHSCTPYYSGRLARFGEHVVWAESSVTIFANSVLGARTNRESNPTAISSALTGKTPLYGLHVNENRAGSILVEVICDIRDSSGYSALGFYLGSKVGSDIPVFLFKKARPNIDNLKSLGAALATSGQVALFHAVGFTPEAPDQKSAFQNRKPVDRIRVTDRNIQETLQGFSKQGSDKVDHVMIGCPHASLVELREVASLLEAKKVHPQVKMWICTSSATRHVAERTGIVQAIEKAGAKVVADTCTSNIPMKEMGFKTMATNSTKVAKYCSEKGDLDVFVGSLRQCVKCAIDNTWSESVQ